MSNANNIASAAHKAAAADHHACANHHTKAAQLYDENNADGAVASVQSALTFNESAGLRTANACAASPLSEWQRAEHLHSETSRSAGPSDTALQRPLPWF